QAISGRAVPSPKREGGPRPPIFWWEVRSASVILNGPSSFHRAVSAQRSSVDVPEISQGRSRLMTRDRCLRPYPKRPPRIRAGRLVLQLELLEDRTLLSTSYPLDSVNWTALGPAPIKNGTNPSTGRVAALAAHPAEPNTVYAATAGGGVWKTT